MTQSLDDIERYVLPSAKFAVKEYEANPHWNKDDARNFYARALIRAVEIARELEKERRTPGTVEVCADCKVDLNWADDFGCKHDLGDKCPINPATSGRSEE